ncbi:U-box domain-containing protein 33 [Andrographis paniculata]|uniref:U-box domain-containing protein 33 n=1 Tax=Andrographis paniculata TaxID=175694 RepID=UPI0021E7C060|nr:U-box domain-containing protein 33 [Andrographis paniculata]
MRAEREIVEVVAARTASSPVVTEGVMFVALGKDVKEGETVLMWALHNSRRMKICVLHVHQPAQKIPMMGTKVPISLMEEHQVKAYHEEERKKMHKTLDKYVHICNQSGVQAEKLWKESDSIEKCIVQLVSDNAIRWLVMGAAANRSYSRKMKEPKSKKANYVRTEAPSFCHISFVCKGKLIFTREGKSDGINLDGEATPFQPSPYSQPGIPIRSRSVAEAENRGTRVRSPSIEYRRARSDNHVMQQSAPSTGSARSFPQGSLNPEDNSDCDTYSRGSLSVGSQGSTFSSEVSALITPSSEGNEIVSELPGIQQDHEDQYHSSVASSGIDGSMNDGLYDKLEQFVAEAESSQKEAFDESMRRKKAEKDVIEAIRKVKACEAMYAEELRRRREIEETLASGRGEAEEMRRQLNEVIYDLRAAQEQRFSLECQIADSDKLVEELEQKMFSAVELLQKYKNERDKLQVERDSALREAEELRKKQTEAASSSSVSQFFSEFSFLEIEEATNNFSQSMKIGEGGYGSIYKGHLRHTQVAIKMLHPNSSQGPFEFQQEVNILSKLRHPNIVTLIGACPEAWALVYEYLPNGSLEDRLNCRNNTPPLSWKARIRIAAELCSALMFLHSCPPHGVVHGDLKPSNLLLDSNFVCKLGDFGICRQLPKDEFSENNTTPCCRTDPKGTLIYMDPEFLSSGELTPKSDVYSFGIILLRLLTGRPALGITKEVQYAIDKGNLNDLLDATAGDWPFVQAKQLAYLALSCTDMKRRDRPDLASEVWKVLEPMKVSCGVSSRRVGSEEQRYQIPSYFVCPIFQEIMQDPVVAADGFTYELEALKGWLESGHDTSPMTNLKLPHCDLLPNHALRSAIQEWLHTP